MSNKALNHVWEHSTLKGTALLLMIAIADMANDDGECYPGKARLSRKCRTTKDNIKKLLKKCEESGELIIQDGMGMETINGWTNRYVLTGLKVTPGNASTPVPGDSSTPLPGNASTPKPSVKPSVKPKSAGKPAKSPKPKTPRPRNPMYDAIEKAFGYSDDNKPTKTVESQIGMASAELIKAGYVPEQVPIIYAYCKAQTHWTGFTPRALASHAGNAIRVNTKPANNRPVVTAASTDTPADDRAAIADLLAAGRRALETDGVS